MNFGPVPMTVLHQMKSGIKLFGLIITKHVCFSTSARCIMYFIPYKANLVNARLHRLYRYISVCGSNELSFWFLEA